VSVSAAPSAYAKHPSPHHRYPSLLLSVSLAPPSCHLLPREARHTATRKESRSFGKSRRRGTIGSTTTQLPIKFYKERAGILQRS
jgi:hypothetical protein